MLRYLRHRYYSKLMLINTAIVCVTSILYGILAIRSTENSARVDQLQIYEDTLTRVQAAYTAKQSEFLELMLTFYEETEHFDAISRLLDTPPEEVRNWDAFELQSITKTMQRLCNKDRDIVAVYIYKRNSDTMYEYAPATNILRVAGDDFAYYEDMRKKNLSRTIYGLRNIGGSGHPGEYEFVYGIGGNLNSHTISIHEQPGNILVAYDESGIRREVYATPLHPESRFLICTVSGTVIFDTSRDYIVDGGYTSFEAASLSVELSKRVLTIENKDFYYALKHDVGSDYFSLYLVPRSYIEQRSRFVSLIIGLGALIFVAISLILFWLSARLSTNRIRALERGMHHIGRHNLAYRIPLPKNDDEFASISRRFNDMCDDLEQTIDKVYRYEIGQKNAELYALQTSINPHFLYNTLETVRSRLISGGTAEASEMLILLARLYRSQTKGRMFVSLREEVNQCNIYIDLFTIRYADRLQFTNAIPTELLRYALPKHTLQPIIENFIVHGLKEDENHILLEGRRTENGMILTISDNGRGVDDATLSQMREMLQTERQPEMSNSGLYNVHERLKIVFGNEFGLELRHRRPGPGFTVELKMATLGLKDFERRHGLDTDVPK